MNKNVVVYYKREERELGGDFILQEADHEDAWSF